MTPHRGNTILFRSSQQLPRLCLGLIQLPLSALDSPLALLPELKGHGEVSRVGRRGPRTPSKTADTNLDRVFFLKTHISTLILDCEKSTE